MVNLDPFDCESDPCHLAWLLRDERHLLKSVSQARCSRDGRLFVEIDRSLFGNCASYYPCVEDAYKERSLMMDTTQTVWTLVVCSNNIPLNQVKALFHQKAADVTYLGGILLLLQPLKNEYIPSNIIGRNHRFTRIIHIACTRNRGDISVTKLRVDRDAFSFTRNVTRIVKIDYCDLSDLDLNFLTGFNNLEQLAFEFTANLHMFTSFLSLPQLPSLSALSVSGVSSGFDELVGFPKLMKGLEAFQLSNLTSEKVNTASIHGMMNWLAVSSTDTLKKLVIQDVNSREIPPLLSSFRRLETLIIEKDKIPVIRSTALTAFSAPVVILSLYNNGINHIEPGAFRGIQYIKFVHQSFAS